MALVQSFLIFVWLKARPACGGSLARYVWMMRKTLFVSDLDGTLLNRDSQLSQESVALLNRLITDKGVNFTIATARTPATVVNIMERVSARLPFIVMNGAATWDNAARRFVSTSPLSPETVDAVCRIFESHGLCPLVYRRCGEKLEVHHYGSLSEQEEGFVSERQGLALKRFYLDDKDYMVSENEALLIFAMNEYERLKAVYDEVERSVECSTVCYHDIFDFSVGLMETYAPGTSKAIAVHRLASEIGAERLVVFGDNLNDIPMMRIADCAVAPANAVEEVKAVADVVIEPNYTHSVARYISGLLESPNSSFK